MLLTISFQFVLTARQSLVLVLIYGAVFVILPPVNYMRVLFFICRHNAHLAVAVPSQMTTIFQREKKVALDMCIITVLLFASISPAAFMVLLRNRYPGVHSILLPWSLTMASILSSVNPVIYFGRNKNMRTAFKFIMKLMGRVSPSRTVDGPEPLQSGSVIYIGYLTNHVNRILFSKKT